MQSTDTAAFLTLSRSAKNIKTWKNRTTKASIKLNDAVGEKKKNSSKYAISGVRGCTDQHKTIY